MIGERRRAHAHGDQPFEQPLSEECSPSCLRVGLQRLRWKGHTDPARKRGDNAIRRELGSPKRRVDPLSRERIEEIGGVTYEDRATAVCDHCANGPVTSTSRTRRRGLNRPARPENRSNSSKNVLRKSRRSWRTVACGTTNATVVTPPPTGPMPT